MSRIARPLPSTTTHLPPRRKIAVFGLVFGAVTGGLIMWYFGNRTREFAADNMMGARKSAADRLPADTTEGAPDRAKEQVRSGHSATSTIDPSRSPR
jgi:hypothetical protein